MVNGRGLRVSLFVSGCVHRCKGCYNVHTQDFKAGNTYTQKTEERLLEDLSRPYIDGLSLLGGDPLMKVHFNVVLRLCKCIKVCYPTKTIWLWTGWTLEEVQKSPTYSKILPYIDVLVDGKFEEGLYSPDLDFRGSSNQVIHWLN